MKKNFRFLALSAAIISMFTACQREELDQNQNPEGLTHTVTFLAGDAGTKTIVDIIDGKTAKFSFTEGDIDRITIWENGVEGTVDKTNSSVENGIMTITATFVGGETEENKTYTAVLNTSSISTQIVSSNSYDEDADVLVAKPVTTAVSGIKFQFKREVAIAKMTLKGLDAGEVVSMITVSSTADIAGSYGVEGWTSPKTSLEISSALAMAGKGYSIVANESGEADVWFTCIPQDATTLTVKVEAADGDTYTKEFSKPITLTQGDVKGFGVTMVKDVKVVPSYTIVFLNSSVGAGTTLNTTTKAETVIKEGLDYVLSQPFTQKTNCYYGGEQPLRVGKSGDAGSLVIALSELGQVPATRIILSSKQYKSGTTSKIGVGDLDKQQPGEDYTDLSFDLDGSTITSITLNSDNYLYVKSITVEYGGTIKTKLATPTNLVVKAEKVVSWDAVDGAASYDLTIGSAKFTCKTNSYNAAEIADEYYDVAVVAVPSDTENYKNSDAATLPDAKFGTPTLSTPEITAGVIEETSVAFSWTKDTRAIRGYHWALYNGETLIKEATETSATSAEVTSLEFGTTYTAKVYAIAVDGEKPYVQSATATLALTTKAKTTISTIVNAGSGSTKYAISDLTVMAVSGKYFVVKDETGIMTAYKSTNATAAVGDIATLEGTYGATNGLNLFTYTSYSKGDTPGAVDHGTPFVLNSENISDYTSNSSLKYVKATVSVGSDGSTLSIGSTDVYMRPSSGVSVSEYAGKTITMLGYAFGYDTSYKNVVILATSVEIDQTVPYLAVSPTSKTWASEEVDATVFTVTTNTEGEKGWTVSPETLDWATIEVAAGTITVTPTSSNDTETARVATLTVSHSASTLSEEITLTQKGKGATTPASITINSQTENFPSSYGTANTFAEYTLNGLKYMIQQIYVSGEKLQWRASGNKNGTGTMYNSEEMPAGIASIVITYNTSDDNKNHTVKTGASANPTSATSITPTKQGNVYTYSCDGTSKYFVITNGTGAGYIDSIVINFE